jgi:ubiquinone/menaquinone biosynthesis C-methylase UbiE
MSCAAQTNDRGFKGLGMEGRIATWYARNTRKDMAQFQALAARFAAEMVDGSRILEVAPGPGYLSIELAKRGRYCITGLDISRTFVQIARENAQRDGVEVDFRQGNASAMPFAQHSFDLIVCRAAFKNFSQPVAALNEMHRVLTPGGRAFILDLNREVSMNDIKAYIARSDLGWIDSSLYKVIFRYVLIPRAYSKLQFSEMAAKSHFSGCEVEPLDLGLEVVLRKQAGGA